MSGGGDEAHKCHHFAERSTLLRRRPSGDSSHLLFALAVAVVFVATLYFARVVIVPVTLAVLFTFLLTPVVSLLERIRLPRAASALLVVLLGVAAVGAFGWMVAKQFVNVTEQLPNYATNIQQKIAVPSQLPRQQARQSH